jgi:hypothetical protein
VWLRLLSERVCILLFDACLPVLSGHRRKVSTDVIVIVGDFDRPEHAGLLQGMMLSTVFGRYCAPTRSDLAAFIGA